MKVAFDQNVPAALAKVFIALASERMIQRISQDLVFEKADDYTPRKTDADFKEGSDVPWLERFAKSGGRAIITGDVKMRERVHERLALYEHDFVVIFFEAQWANWKFLRKCSLMLHWWEEIAKKIRTAEPGTFWVVPAAWPPKGGELRNVSLGLARLLKDNPARQSTARKRKRKHASKPSRDDREPTFLLEAKLGDDEV